MRLDDLLAMMERRPADTPDTPCNRGEVSTKPASILACTFDTPDTPRNDNAGSTDTVPNPASGDVAVLREAEAFDSEAFEERAAIMEFDGGLSRAEADRLALAADPLPDPAAEARRQRVLAMLAERPGIRYAVLTDSQADQEAVLLTLAIRGVGTCELAIPRAKYDGVLLLDLLERHGGTVH